MRPNRFVYLFAGLLAMLVAEPVLDALFPDRAVLPVAFTLALVVGVWTLAPDRRVFGVGVGLTVLAVAASSASTAAATPAADPVGLAVVAAFCALSMAITVREVVLRRGPVDLNRLMGALCVYLLIGTFFACLFGLLAWLDPGAFRHPETPGDDAARYLYFSFVTLTTLGYGDIVPVHPLARSLAYLEAIAGQLFLAVLVASLVARYMAEPARRGDD